MIGLLLNWRVWAAIIFAVAQVAFGWKMYHAGMTSVQVAWSAANLKAETEARAVEQQRAQTVQKAQNEHTKQIQTAQRDNDVARSELDGLRSILKDQRERHDATSQSASAANKRADTAGELLATCAAEYQIMGRHAQGHAIDTQMLLSAWPK